MANMPLPMLPPPGKMKQNGIQPQIQIADGLPPYPVPQSLDRPYKMVKFDLGPNGSRVNLRPRRQNGGNGTEVRYWNLRQPYIPNYLNTLNLYPYPSARVQFRENIRLEFTAEGAIRLTSTSLGVIMTADATWEMIGLVHPLAHMLITGSDHIDILQHDYNGDHLLIKFNEEGISYTSYLSNDCVLLHKEHGLNHNINTFIDLLNTDFSRDIFYSRRTWSSYDLHYELTSSHFDENMIKTSEYTIVETMLEGLRITHRLTGKILYYNLTSNYILIETQKMKVSGGSSNLPKLTIEELDQHGKENKDPLTRRNLELEFGTMLARNGLQQSIFPE